MINTVGACRVDAAEAKDSEECKYGLLSFMRKVDKHAIYSGCL